MRVGDEAYGVPILGEIERQTGRELTLATVYKTLSRLEDKGLVSSRTGEPTPARGGRRKRYYTPTAEGRRALHLLAILLPRAEREAFVGDLVEEFDVRRRAVGDAGARRWLWRQTLAALAMCAGSPRRADPAPAPTSGDPLVLSFLADVRHGARLLRRAPAFALLATLTLGVGIGATTAIFSVVDPVLLRPLPYPHADRLMTLWERDAEGGRSNMGYATFLDIVASSRSIEGAAVSGSWQPTVSGEVYAERLTGRRVSWRYFDVLGVRIVLGRDFVQSDDA